AVRTVSRRLLSAPGVVSRRPVEVVRHDEIEPAILVKVEPSSTGGPHAAVCYACLGGDIGESAVTIVVIQNRTAIARDIQVGVAIVVEVTDRHALAIVSLAADASLVCYVGERAVSVVVIERGAQRMHR